MQACEHFLPRRKSCSSQPSRGVLYASRQAGVMKMEEMSSKEEREMVRAEAAEARRARLTSRQG